MAMPSVDEVRDWAGLDVQDVDGTDLGRLVRIYVDPGDGTPAWLLFTSPTAGNSFFAPARDAKRKGSVVVLAAKAPLIFSSPVLGTPAELAPEDEARLTRHYETTPAPSVPERLKALTRTGLLGRLRSKG